MRIVPAREGALVIFAKFSRSPARRIFSLPMVEDPQPHRGQQPYSTHQQYAPPQQRPPRVASRTRGGRRESVVGAKSQVIGILSSLFWWHGRRNVTGSDAHSTITCPNLRVPPEPAPVIHLIDCDPPHSHLSRVRRRCALCTPRIRSGLVGWQCLADQHAKPHQERREAKGQ